MPEVLGARLQPRPVDAAPVVADLDDDVVAFTSRGQRERTRLRLASSAALRLVLEAVVLGRTAMGERLTDIAMTDAWRIRRGGRLVFADTTRLEGDAVSVMNGPATGGGAVAFATMIVVAPDAGRHVEPLRAGLDGMAGEAGVSGLEGVTVVRLLAASGQALRALAVRAATIVRGTAMPRVWSL